jgi:hypothetical protein
MLYITILNKRKPRTDKKKKSAIELDPSISIPRQPENENMLKNLGYS